MSNQIIFTKHARERMSLRSVRESDVITVVQRPHQTLPTDKPETTKFIRTLRERELQVVAKHLSGENKTLIISVWVRGEEDPTPLLWRVLTLPFTIVVWLSKWLWKTANGKKRK